MKLSKKGISIVLVIILICLGLSTFLIFEHQPRSANQGKEAEIIKLNVKDRPHLGNPNAKVQIVYFGDYQCPWCKKFEEEIIPKLKKDYLNNGKASFYFVNEVVLGDDSFLAANASEIILKEYPASYWKFHNELFAHQGQENSGWINQQSLLNYAKKSVSGLDQKKFLNELNAIKYQESIHDDLKLGEKWDVTGTPTVFINGNEVKNVLDYHSIQTMIEEN